jgi:hypothetical protein
MSEIYVLFININFKVKVKFWAQKNVTCRLEMGRDMGRLSTQFQIVFSVLYAIIIIVPNDVGTNY